MVSTTDNVVRVDNAGSGYFGACRGDRFHNGIDECCTPGQWVKAPVHGRVIRHAYPYADRSYDGVLIRNPDMAVKIFYFEPDDWIMGTVVKAGDRIGIAQDISKRYPGQGMKPHIHVEALVDPHFLWRLMADG